MNKFLILLVAFVMTFAAEAQQAFPANNGGGVGRRAGGPLFNRLANRNYPQRQGQAENTPSATGTQNGVASPTAEAYASAAADQEQESDLNFVGADLGMVFKVYSVLVNKTILRDPAVADKAITLKSEKGQKLTKEEQIEAIEMILEMNDVHLEPYGEKFIRAVPRTTASKEAPSMVDAEGLGESGKVVSIVIRLNYISYEEAMKILQEVASSKAKLQGIERNNSILVTDTELNIKRMLEIVKRIDVESKPTEEVKIYQIKHASAADVQQVLQKIVEESQKELDKNGKRVNNTAQPQQPWMRSGFGRMSGGVRSNNQPQATTPSTSSILSNISDADRGLIRGKVVILSDERSNKLVIITSEANHKFFKTLIDEIDVETTPDTVVKVYRLKYAESDEVSDMINDLIGNAPSSKTSSKQNQNQNAQAGRSSNLTNRSNPAQNASANKRTSEAGTGELSKDNTTVLSDKRINGLVVMTHKELVPVVEKIIESMDIKLSQVLIETAIIEVTLGDELSTGIDWVQKGAKDSMVNRGNYMLGGGGGGASSDLLKQMMMATTNAVADAAFGGANPIGSGIAYLLKSDRLNISAVIKASQTDNRAKYLASPVIMTVDNKEATIDATESRKFFSGYETSSSYQTYVRTPKYDSKDIGIKIKVKPKINPNGTVMLNVEEEYSQLGAGQSILVDNGGKETVDTSLMRKMTADILLDDMQTVVLGGLTEKYKAEKENGIPFLKDIPWIGKWLFGSVSQNETRKELLVFMTPYVLDDADAAKAEAIRRKKTLSDPKPWDDGGWSASELSDGVSKKEQMRRIKDEWAKQDEERKNKLAIEQLKVERAKKLEQLSKEEREVWLKMHKEEIEEDERKALEEKMLDKDSQDGLRMLVEEIKKEKLEAAQKEIDKAAEELKKENESEKQDNAKGSKKD